MPTLALFISWPHSADPLAWCLSHLLPSKAFGHKSRAQGVWSYLLSVFSLRFALYCIFSLWPILPGRKGLAAYALRSFKLFGCRRRETLGEIVCPSRWSDRTQKGLLKAHSLRRLHRSSVVNPCFGPHCFGGRFRSLPRFHPTFALCSDLAMPCGPTTQLNRNSRETGNVSF